ncbi:hypothetical protein, partial [Streptosporangium sp. NPDC051022]|uniref:hypothetical protein n=1 Tax=Streptosporangium sp. NPDC051022 TaxID=3155752 RepID=UPI0034339C8B
MPTSSPSRAAYLLRLADAEDAAGRPIAARMTRIVAEAEMLLDNPNSVPMDAAWDDDDWWNLAATRDRHE